MTDAWSIIEPLYSRHFDGLVRGLEKKLSRAEAEDIVQSAFVELRGKIEGGNVKNPKALLERIVDQRRRDHKRDSFHEVAAGLTPGPFTPPLHDSIDRGLLRMQLAEAIRALPGPEWAAFILCELRGLSDGAAAAHLNRPRSTVATWKRNAYVKLVSSLAGSRDVGVEGGSA
jgi:DNA-directed RNA polymerase specialized sigma24 family protein